MSRAIAVIVMSFLLTSPAQLLAKGKTVKIVVEGADLQTPLMITDPKVVTDFQVWSGFGTKSNLPGFDPAAPSFIVDWSQGPTSEPPKDLSHYQVSFYADVNGERLVYAVSYVFDAATGLGYVYLPGRNDYNYSLNVGSIIRGVEGRWFHAWTRWDDVAGRLIDSRKMQLHSRNLAPI